MIGAGAARTTPGSSNAKPPHSSSLMIRAVSKSFGSAQPRSASIAYVRIGVAPVARHNSAFGRSRKRSISQSAACRLIASWSADTCGSKGTHLILQAALTAPHAAPTTPASKPNSADTSGTSRCKLRPNVLSQRFLQRVAIKATRQTQSSANHHGFRVEHVHQLSHRRARRSPPIRRSAARADRPVPPPDTSGALPRSRAKPQAYRAASAGSRCKLLQRRASHKLVVVPGYQPVGCWQMSPSIRDAPAYGSSIDDQTRADACSDGDVQNEPQPRPARKSLRRGAAARTSASRCTGSAVASILARTSTSLQRIVASLKHLTVADSTSSATHTPIATGFVPSAPPLPEAICARAITSPSTASPPRCSVGRNAARAPALRRDQTRGALRAADIDADRMRAFVGRASLSMESVHLSAD